MSLVEMLTQPPSEAARESDGFLRGLAVGVVTDNKDPERLGRVRVRLPQQQDSDTSFWARIAVPMAGAARGTWFLPEIGDDVVVGAECGDPAHLIVLGGLWTQNAAPPATNDDGKNDVRTIKSRAGHTLAFNDGSDPEVALALADGKRLLLNRDGVTLEDGQGNRIVIDATGSAISIESATQLQLKSQSISIEAGASLVLKAAGTLTIQGAVVQIN